MAVVDKYADANTENGLAQKNALVSGSPEICMVNTVEVAAGDDDGSVYRFFKGLDSTLIITDIKVNNDAITGGTAFHVGLYDAEKGAVVDADIFAASLDLSSAHATGSEISGMTAVAIENKIKMLYEHLGKTVANRKPRYDLCLTGATVGTAAGTITVTVRAIQG